MTSQKQKIIQEINNLLSQNYFPAYFRTVFFSAMKNKKVSLRWLKALYSQLNKKVKILNR